MMQAFVTPPAVDDDDAMGLSAMAEVAPGGHYFGAARALECYETAFCQPLVADGRNFETWREACSTTTAENANRVWKQLLADHEEPAIGLSVAQAIDEFVARRTREIKASGL